MRYLSSPIATTGSTHHLTERRMVCPLKSCLVHHLTNDNFILGRLAFCGKTGQITFHFPFTEFIPPEQKIHFTAKVGLVILMIHL